MNIAQSIYDSMLNLFNNHKILSKYTYEEIKEEIENVLNTQPSPSTQNPDILATQVIESLEFKYLSNELSSEYDLLDKDSFLSSVALRVLPFENLLSIYEEDFAKLKAKYKNKIQQLQTQCQQLSDQLSASLPNPSAIQLSEEELFNITYPDLNTILLSEEYMSKDANVLCNVNNIKYNFAVFALEHYPLFSYIRNPVNSPSFLDNKLYPYGLPEMREPDSSTMLPVNFDPASEVYMIGVSLHSFKLKPNKLSCARMRYENNSNYNSLEWIEESLPRCHDTQFYFSQPTWEAFQERYDYQINYIISFAVFKAKPSLPQSFKQYWNTQSNSDLSVNCEYFHICKSSNLMMNLDMRYPVMKLFYSSYLMNYYLNLTENVIKNISLNTSLNATQFSQSSACVAALKPGDLVYVNRFNFGIVTGEKEIFLDNNLIITEAESNKFYIADSKDSFIYPELLLFTESILDDNLLSIKQTLTKQYKVYMFSKIKKPAIF